ncbi:MAG TPA: tetratricopeptide repeat protein [Nitrospira sp.]|nr:tetratricopeptide repeat protein [Nitrospira sp.]
MNRFLLVVISSAVLNACAGHKESPPSFDMAEYRQLMERQKGEQGQLGEAEQPATEMTAEEHEKTGDVEAQRRNLPLAGLHYSKALKADPSRNNARYKLGQVFLQQGLVEPALMQFQDLRARDARSAAAYQGIGQALLMQGKTREAEQALEKAVELDQSVWLSHNLLGLAYDQDQRYADAIKSYESALRLRPRDPSILNNLGLAYALMGDHEAAIHAFEQAVASGSVSPKVHNNLGVAYAHRERYAEAFESFKRGGDEPRAYNNLGVALLGMGKPKQAAACFEKAIEANPKFYEKASENLRHARQAIDSAPTDHGGGKEPAGPPSCL